MDLLLRTQTRKRIRGSNSETAASNSEYHSSNNFFFLVFAGFELTVSVTVTLTSIYILFHLCTLFILLTTYEILVSIMYFIRMLLAFL